MAKIDKREKKNSKKNKFNDFGGTLGGGAPVGPVEPSFPTDKVKGDIQTKTFQSKSYVMTDEEEPVRGTHSLREVHITPLDYGFVVKVGCKSVAVPSIDILLTKLSKYLKDYDTVEELWHTDGGKTFMKN